MKFEDLGLSPEILEAISRMGFQTPTPVQAKVIPRLLENKGDMVALAQTGTGKTAAFGLPILHMIDHSKLKPQALVLCPTRELCVQITRDIKAFSACSESVKSVAVYGGTPIEPQLKAIKRGVQIIVATPGRMLDILRRKKADLTNVERVILDEADEMLNMGFQEDLEAILSEVPDSAHSLLFSATMPRQVASIAKKYMTDPEEITVGERNAGADNVTHECYIVHQRDRYRALKRIADYYPDMYAIVFCRTRQDTQHVADWLIRDGYNVDALHGDLSQTQRDRVMDKFRSKSIQILVATDVAARGLDVNDLTHVVNYNLPDDLGSYTHRSGRTGRAGKSGTSVVIVNMREKGKVRRIEHAIKKEFVYRDIPTPRVICEAQLFTLINRMKSVEMTTSDIDEYLPDIYTALEGMERDEIIKRFVSLEFNTLLKYYRGAKDLNEGVKQSGSRGQERGGRKQDRDNKSRRERNDRRRDDRPPRKDKQQRKDKRSNYRNVKMFVNLGTSDGVNQKKLSKLIGAGSGRSVPADQIDVQKRCAFFEVPSNEAGPIMLTLSDTVYRGRNVRVEPINDEQNDKRKKSSDRKKGPQKEKSFKSRRAGKNNKNRARGTGAPKKNRTRKA